MSCDILSKVENNDVAAGDLNVNTKHIRELTQQILNTTDCDSLKLLVQTHTVSLQQLMQSVLGDSLVILDKILPILTLPGANPFKIVKYLGKLVVGLAMPQLEAYVRYTQQLIELTTAATELAAAVNEVLPRLRSCAIETVSGGLEGIESEINKTLFERLDAINASIRSNICGTFEETGAGIVIDSIISTEQLVGSLNNLVDSLNGSVTSSLNTISQTQTLITSLTGGSAVFVTSSPVAFSQSLIAGALESFSTETNNYLDQAAPSNTVVPVITGTPEQGSTLTVSQGTWTPSTGVTFSYQWYRSTTPITGATNNQYVVTASDVGQTIKCLVSAENSSYDSPTSVFTNSTSTVTSPYTAPTNTVAPSITGTLNAGQTLTCSTGTWTGTSPITYQYQWQWSHVSLNITGANTNTYVVSSQDVGRTLCCLVTATNIANSTTISSNIVTIT